METDRTDAHIFGVKTHFPPKTEGNTKEKKSQKNVRLCLAYFVVMLTKHYKK